MSCLSEHGSCPAIPKVRGQGAFLSRAAAFGDAQSISLPSPTRVRDSKPHTQASLHSRHVCWDGERAGSHREPFPLALPGSFPSHTPGCSWSSPARGQNRLQLELPSMRAGPAHSLIVRTGPRRTVHLAQSGGSRWWWDIHALQTAIIRHQFRDVTHLIGGMYTAKRREHLNFKFLEIRT